uniref:Uncharacterized protein n=1 Tax=Chromera velia CCMP2878 TaxID=1169474 RepID=A0A0G4HDF3_9ALVE|eukprot:Cvel_947.t1-p1 / transcript=Cvel_947.t1 / gene=Cvel_947 / organism=Chromera_velia_CCMP2878 / gene_product=hypothetical protein / transcript_product=hypothetical protein / location=Cvel_scaffold30:125294-129191(+) / protein_length=995 / sequence_SO=supercontig / SO=protein_coding / is_pseudo=false
MNECCAKMKCLFPLVLIITLPSCAAALDLLLRCTMEVPEDPMPDCRNSELFFPSPETQTYMLRGYLKDEQAQVYENSKSGLLLVFKQDDDHAQEVGRVSVEAQEPLYLDQEEYGLRGGWFVLSSRERRIVAYAQTTSVMDQMVPSDEMDFWVCGHQVHVEIDCQVRDSPPHVEAGIEGSPCTIFGDCSGEDDLVCGMYHPQHAVCMTPEKAKTEGVRVVRGVQKSPPYSNCFYSRSCLVEGFQCFQNTLYTDFAWCLYPEACPKKTGLELLKSELEGEVRKPSGRRLLADWTKEDHTPQGALKKVKASIRKAQGRASKPGKQRRRLFEACVQEGILGSADTAPDMKFGSGDASTDKAKKFKEVTYRCGKVHFDIANVCNDEPLDLDFEATGQLGEVSVRDSDHVRSFVDQETDTLEQEVKNWLHKEWHDLGGREGWDCKTPLGPVASIEDPGVISKKEYRAICSAQGMNPFVCAPLNEEERAHRRRRRLPAAQMLGDFASELGTFRSTKPDSNIPLTPPPLDESEEHEWSLTFVCPGVPNVGRAPSKVYAPQLICGPTYSFAPSVDVGSSWYWAPVFTFAPILTIAPFFTWAPYFTFAVSIFGGVEFAFAPVFLFGPLVNLGPLLELAPIFQFIPLVSIAPITTYVAQYNLVPDILEYWKFSRGEFPPSTVKRFETKGRFGIKDTGKPDLANATEFFYGQLLPVNDIVNKVTSIPAGGLPLSQEKAQKLGLKKSYTLGTFISVSTAPSIICPRKVVGLKGNCTQAQQNANQCPFPEKYREYRGGEHIRIFFIEPTDGNTFIFGDDCLVPYPSDVLRDIPYLPKWAYPAIRLAESVENLIPKPLKVAANSALSLLQVLSEGRYPDPAAWLQSLHGERYRDRMESQNSAAESKKNYLEEGYTGTSTFEREFRNMTVTHQEGTERKMTWSKAFEIASLLSAGSDTEAEMTKGLFDRDSPLSKAARGEIDMRAFFRREITKPMKILFPNQSTDKDRVTK